MELVEREEHLAALDAWLGEVRARRRGRLVLVAGEAGVGKTALVRAFGERERTAPVLVGGCEPLFTARPLGPLLDIAAEIGGPLAGVLEDGAAAGDVLAALARSLRAPASVVVLEDLHWADEATLDVLRLLDRRVGGLPALVVGTYRDDELTRDHPLRLVLGELRGAHRLAVEPLSPDAVAALAAAHGLDAATLHASTGGNPFYVTELLARPGDGTPRTVRDAVLARAARLPPRARRLLEAVAVARPRAEIWLLEAIAAGDVSALEQCLASGMLRASGGAVAFRHEIARAAIEDELPPDRRVSLHRAALAALAGRGEPARLAHHAEAAGDGAAVLEHSTAAGERAARLGAHRQAAAHFGAALRHADALDPAARAELLEARARECFMSSMIDEAVEAETAALELHRAAGDRLREGDTHRRIARVAWYGGDGAGGRAAEAAAIELLETVPPGPELALAYTARVASRMMARDLEGAREWGAKAIGLAERLGETEVLVAATRHVGTAEMCHGLPEGREKVRRSLDVALAAGLKSHVAVAWCNLVASAHEVRDLDRAAADLEAGRAWCEEHDMLAWATYLAGCGAQLALDRGDWDEAAALAGELLERTRGDLPQSRYRALLTLGMLHARRGDEDPWPLLDEALAIAVGVDQLERLGSVCAARAEARWLAGEHDRVAEETERGLALARESGHAWTAGPLLVWRHRAGMPAGQGDTAWLPPPYRAELAGDAGAAAAFWRERGCGYDAALAAGTGSGDEEELRDALDALEDLGARPASAIVAGRMRERGVSVRRRGPRPETRQPGRPDLARARGARAARRGRPQRRHRGQALHLREDRGPPRLGDPAQARRPHARPGGRGGGAARDRRRRDRIGRPPDVGAAAAVASRAGAGAHAVTRAVTSVIVRGRRRSGPSPAYGASRRSSSASTAARSASPSVASRRRTCPFSRTIHAQCPAAPATSSVSRNVVARTSPSPAARWACAASSGSPRRPNARA